MRCLCNKSLMKFALMNFLFFKFYSLSEAEVYSCSQLKLGELFRILKKKELDAPYWD